MTALTEWSTFYQITGSAAGALTGLQFVSLALIADLPVEPGQAETGDAFVTPTIVHFATVLVVTAILSAPWHGIEGPAVLWGLVGLLGGGYTIAVMRRMRAQNLYQPVFEDWCFHFILPLLAYATLALAALFARTYTRPALFAEAAAAVLLLLVGIHNSWDNVAFLVLKKRSGKDS